MKKNHQKPNAFFKLFCGLFGHNYEVSKNITYHVKEYKCSKCNHELTTNGNGKLIELCPKFREINAILARIHNKKTTRLSRTIIPKVVYKMSS